MTTKVLPVQSAMYQCALKMQAMWQLLLECHNHREKTIETKQDQVEK